MKWCETIGTEPYLCLNFGTGTLDEGMFTPDTFKFSITKVLSSGLGRILQRHREYILRQPPPEEWPRKAL